MALYVASHYKNSPNDLQMLSDAPAHHLFCLLPPVPPTQNSLPEVLAVIQVSLEGEISRQSILSSLSRGKKASGDLIPWTVSEQVGSGYTHFRVILPHYQHVFHCGQREALRYW
ncbi:hypothetical protein FKM82_024773 [Ascaphus truei]